ncbi:SAM-dependent methyltransferase [Subtercola sp. Z020]|uniref:class I SAM-dependent methyltransferase n=1 Tax=Subtercola sp. Z020 TaxID=2080582 RepID=UPI000CE8A8C2|nr:methyltransferase [Subtercola sp. Z020]PPF85196.1 SAM-dependent methyltransferase [Subtercola sp. Z020]
MYELLDTLRRDPDIEAPNLFASDTADRLVLDEAAGALSAAGPGEVVVIGDRYGALTLGAADAYALSGIRSHQDRLVGEIALAQNAERAGLSDRFVSLPLGEELLTGARVVLLQLPRGLVELDEIADAIARWADPGVVLFAGGRIKHLTRAMNDTLAVHFDDVRASLARQKSRVLVARGARRPVDAVPYPVLVPNAELGLVVAAHGGAFAGATLDIGTRFVLEFVDRAVETVQGLGPDATAIDLGCGTGIIAARLAERHPGLRVLATDQSAAAVASASATMRANGLDDRVRVVRDDGLSNQADRSAALIVCNPPFHVGSAVHTGVALALFREAGRVLRPGGLLVTVFNSHLAHRSELQRLVGSSEVWGQNPKFTVIASIAPPT